LILRDLGGPTDEERIKNGDFIAYQIAQALEQNMQ